jgi:hypothetical protein
MDAPRIVAEIQKTARDPIRIGLDTDNGYDLMSVWVWVPNASATTGATETSFAPLRLSRQDGVSLLRARLLAEFAGLLALKGAR